MRGKPADLLVEFGDLLLVRRSLGGLGALVFLEESGHRAQHRGLPLAELVGMDAVFGGDLGQGLVVAQDLGDDLRLENGGEMS